MVAINRSPKNIRDSDDMNPALDMPIVRSKDGRGVVKWANAPRPFRIPDKNMPTNAPPGTVEKLNVLIERETRSEQLFHPYDARWDGDVRPLVWYLMRHKEQEDKRLLGVG